MSTPNVTDAQIIEGLLTNNGNIRVTAKVLGVPRSTLVSRIAKIKVKEFKQADREDPTFKKNARLAGENRALKTKLKDSTTEVAQLAKLCNVYEQLSDVAITPSEWTVEVSSEKREAIATAFLSDVHYGETVDPSQIDDVNGYNREVAEGRLERFFQAVVKLKMKHFSDLNIKGVIVAMGGDMVSGTIHEELTETNEMAILESCVELAEILCSGIKLVAKEYDKVFVPCVVGNHGRLTKQYKCKGAVKDNYDWLVYRLVAKHFEKSKKVDVVVSTTTDARWEIYGTKYRLTHGNQFRGGNGIAGVFSPIMRGDHKKRKRDTSVGQPYDVLLIGHFHSLMPMGRVICNGSIKGYDEYAYQQNFDFEPPQQAFWITTPNRGPCVFVNIDVLKKDEYWLNETNIDVVNF